MRNGSLLVVCCVAVGGVAAGCSDPGGGGGGLADADAAAEVLFDTGNGEVDATPSCTNGARQCSGQTAQQCVNGAWQTSSVCRDEQVCQAGACFSGETTGETSNDTTNEVANEVVGPTDPCDNRECGSDGEGGSCGSCLNSETCNGAGQCVSQCVPDCAGKECGSNLCGGICGSCGNFEQCVQGTCELTEVCDCEGAVCGLDNCGNSCGTCSGQTTCSGGLCVSTETGGTCIDMIDCIYDEALGCITAADQAEFDLCVEDCYGSASATGAAEFDAYLGCLNECPAPDDDPATTADDLAYDRCSYQSCSDEEAFCVLETAGSGTCYGILDCSDLCVSGDSACYQGCYEAATPAAQAALWGINNCLTIECPDDTDTTCIDVALQDQCVDFLIACQAN